MKLHKLQDIPTLLKLRPLRKHSVVAFIFCEDSSLIKETIKFKKKRGFDRIFLFVDELEQLVDQSDVYNVLVPDVSRKQIWKVINSALPHLRGNWLYWGYNGEFLYYPFCESRSVHDLSDFMIGERRYNIHGKIIDVYRGDIEKHRDEMSIQNVYFDRVNYFTRPNDSSDSEIDEKERARIQFYFGGMRWRYADYLPESSRRIDLIPFFYVDETLSFDENGLTKRPEFYTSHCEHHHNPTCAIMSFRVSRFLRHNHDTRAAIESFNWEGSLKFRWTSAQLLRMGFIETGQWF